MPRINFNDGQEIIYQDLKSISPALELELYDRILYEVMNRQQNVFFGDSFKAIFVNSTTVQITSGSGFQYDSTQVDPEPKNRLLYLASSTNKTIAAANPSNPRIDIVCVKANRATTSTVSRNFKDATSGVVTSVSQDTETDWSADIVVTTGTAAASPTAPATPSGYIKIAEITVSASTGVASQSAISDKRSRYRKPNGWKSVRTVSATYAVDKDDETVLGNASGGNFTATLPLAADTYDATTGLGKEFTFINIGATGTFTISGSGSEQISEAITQALDVQFASITVRSNGTQYYLI